MHPRKYLIAGNWKMNPAPEGWDAEDSPYRLHEDVDVATFPTFLDLERCARVGIPVGAQFGLPEAAGAHTGDVSMAMVKGVGAQYVLCGHSERRRDHGETNEHVAAQVRAALEAGLRPIVCVGETRQEREAKQQQNIVKEQLSVLPLEADITIAYEPVWAIGTGLTATPEQAQEMHVFIRTLLPKIRHAVTRILYGGSLNAENAKALLAKPDIDGGLIGGASLKPADFRRIIEAAVALS